MIEVIVGTDTAYADTPEEAVYAALTIGREQREAKKIWGFNPEIRFIVGNDIHSTNLRDLSRTQ